MKLKYFSIVVFLSLSGCAVTYHAVDAKKVITPPSPIEQEESAATVTIKRDNQIFMSALDGRFFYDGIHIVTLSRGETYTFSAKPGAHTLGVKSFQPIMYAPVPFSREIDVEFKSGNKYEYVIAPIPSAGLEILAEE